MENGKRVLEFIAVQRAWLQPVGHTWGTYTLMFIAVQRADSNQWAIPGVRKLLHTIYCSHSPTKLLEDNIFSRVCLSVHKRRMGVPVFGPGPNLLPNMFKLVQLGPHCTGPSPPPSPDMFKLVHYEVWTVDEWAVRIWLKCLPVEGPFTLSVSLSVTSENEP